VLPRYGSIPSSNGAIADAGESISAVQLRTFANAMRKRTNVHNGGFQCSIHRKTSI
jgi:hypothetical protein